MSDATVILRAFNRESDQGFIYSSWRNASYYGSSSKPAAKTFFKKQTGLIRDIVEKGTVRIACLADEPDIILGYSVATGTHLEFIYVKVEYRGKGIGTLLMPKDIETVTPFLTKIGAIIADKKNLKVKGELNGSAKGKDTSEAEGPVETDSGTH